MILLTGATGFLGSKLLKRLVDSQYDVVCIKRSTSSCEKVQDVVSQCKWFNNDQDDLESLFQKYNIDIIIHCATNYGRKPGEFIPVYECNLEFPLELIKYSIQYGCKHFINTDTFFVREIDDLWKNNEKVYMDTYVKSKYLFTRIMQDHITEMDIAFINLQMEHLYGPDDDSGKFVDYIVNSCLQNVDSIELTEGKQRRDWTYIDDVVSAYMKILEKISDFTPGKYYHFEVGTGTETSLREFVELVKKLTNSTTRLEFGKREMSAHELETSCADNSELCKLGWEPQYDIASGIEQMIKR